MSDDYYRRFPPTGFPGRENDGIVFTTDDVIDHPVYIGQNPERKLQIERAGSFLAAFDAGRERRHRELARLLKDRHRDNTVLAMTLNRGFAELLLNWVESCDRHGIEVRSWTMIAALDEDTATRFERLGFAVCFPGMDYGRHTSEAVAEYGDDDFGDLMFPKSAVVQDLLSMGFNVLFQDVDLVWMKDPYDFLHDTERSMLDVQFMYDGPNPIYAPLNVNTGFFFLRNTAHSRKFWQLVHQNFDKVAYHHSQQRVVNMLLVHRYFKGLKLDVLAESDFANGHLFSWNDASSLPPDPYVIHCSWTSNLAHKMKKYHLAGLWYL